MQLRTHDRCPHCDLNGLAIHDKDKEGRRICRWCRGAEPRKTDLVIHFANFSTVNWHHSGRDDKAWLTSRSNGGAYVSREKAIEAILKMKKKFGDVEWHPATFDGYAGEYCYSHGDAYFVYITTQLLDMRGAPEFDRGNS